MYSWEIQKYLDERNYHVDSDEMYNIVDTSPQINWIEFNSCSDKDFSYKIGTKDGYTWVVWMKCKP
jgi:hypothetical protein